VIAWTGTAAITGGHRKLLGLSMGYAAPGPDIKLRMISDNMSTNYSSSVSLPSFDHPAAPAAVAWPSLVSVDVARLPGL